VLAFVFLSASALAQTYPQRLPDPQGPAAGPDRPVQPRIPTLVPRAEQQPAPPQPPKAPFALTPEEQAQVDKVLDQWEQRNHDIKTFDCRFTRWIYDEVFGPFDKAKFIEVGTIKYAAPDRGLFHLESSLVNGKEVPIESSRAEHWICDGKSVWEYSPAKKQVIEHKLPPELQGKAIANSPLPFLFGAEAQKLKQRYFIRLLTPSPPVPGQVCLQAFPRYQQDAANFNHAIFIISTEGMSPFALRIVQPNGKDYTNYRFFEVVVNDKFKLWSNPFHPWTPWGWQMVPDQSPPVASKDRGQSQ
jgi:TIGR03009 family protein